MEISHQHTNGIREGSVKDGVPLLSPLRLSLGKDRVNPPSVPCSVALLVTSLVPVVKDIVALSCLEQVPFSDLLFSWALFFMPNLCLLLQLLHDSETVWLLAHK
jgi:hypothetical protein